jgi:transposase
MKDMVIGVDLAKRIFQVHGATPSGDVVYRKKLSREQFRAFLRSLSASLVVFEACGSASYWAREAQSFGHEARLIAPQYVRPFVKRQKNDAADAEAIVIAARQPEMRFVSPKSEDQQARAAVFRGRERLVRQRTELMNALRANFYEYGVVFPIGMNQTTRMTAWLAEHAASLPKLLVDECTDILALIDELTDRITAKTKLLASLASASETARRLQTMPGVGPITALAVEAFAPNMQEFRSGRCFAAWLGLVPKQHSSGGKERLGRVSKAGQTDIRRLLIIGAMSRVIGRGARNVAAQSWLGRLMHRKPKMLAAIALANKMARQLWAMLTHNVDYHDPATRVAA